MPQHLPYYMNGDYFDTRTFGLGNLSPLLGMGSSLAGYMGHSQLSSLLGNANSFMGKYGNYFTNGFGGALGSGGQSGTSQNLTPGGFTGFPFGFGAPSQTPFGAQGTGFGAPGLPFSSSQGFGSPSFSPFGSQGPGLGGFMPSLFMPQGTPTGFGGMPGFF